MIKVVQNWALLQNKYKNMDVSFKLSIFPSLRPVNFTIAAALPSVTTETQKKHTTLRA